MKIHSLTVLHYGKDYLSYALRSIYDSVDSCHIFYSPTPSHGHQTNTPPIETKEELRAAAYHYDPDGKVKWYDVDRVRYEGVHRDLALSTVQNAGADIVIVLDYDEIWPPGLAEKAVKNSNSRFTLVNMIHFWRSFNWACYDENWPVRVIDLRYSSGDTTYLDYSDLGRVFHFGYAIRDEVLSYKIQIHGHKNEFRKDWYQTKWQNWTPDITDVHPTNEKNFWMPKPFDKGQLPGFMKSHPFYDLEKIE